MTSEEPRVTAIVAAYNEERFIAAALESALGQDYPAARVDVVVVDDGSTDATAAVAERYAAVSGRVRVVRQRNGGNVAATNAAIALAGGDVVAILDADDMWAPGHLGRSVEVLADRPQVGLVYGDMTVVDAHGDVLQESWLAGDVTPQGPVRRRAARGQQRDRLLDRHARVGPARDRADPGRHAVGRLVACRPLRAGLGARLPPRAAHALPLPRHEHVARRGWRGPRGELCKAAGFQRHLFRTLRPPDATPRELADGWAAFERNVREAIAVAGPLDERGRARLAAGVHAVLTERSRGALSRPRFGAGDLAALRRLAA